MLVKLTPGFGIHQHRRDFCELLVSHFLWIQKRTIKIQDKNYTFVFLTEVPTVLEVNTG